MNELETLNVETSGASGTGKKGLSDKNKKRVVRKLKFCKFKIVNATNKGHI